MTGVPEKMHLSCDWCQIELERHSPQPCKAIPRYCLVQHSQQRPRSFNTHILPMIAEQMTNKTFWILGPAVFSVIGMIAGYLSNANYTVPAAGGGCFVGFVITCFALAGEKPKQ
jgi:hypothetical protein